MSTIDNKEIIDEIIANDGRFEDDPPVYMIVEYTNGWGNITWGVTWFTEPIGVRTRYLISSEHVQNPRIIWLHKSIREKIQDEHQ